MYMYILYKNNTVNFIQKIIRVFDQVNLSEKIIPR